MAAWKNFPDNIPTDAQTVYVRVKYYYGPVFLAVWDLSSQQFTSVTKSIIYPAWCITRWKSK